MNQTNLQNLIWESSEEGEQYNATEAQIDEFISNRMDNGEFSEFASVEEVEVPDADADAWVEEFKKFIAE